MSLDDSLIVRKIILERDKIEDFNKYPFNIEIVKNFEEVKYKDTEIYKLYRMYLDDPDGMQKRLFD